MVLKLYSRHDLQLIIPKGHNSAKNVDVKVFFSAHHLMKLYICTKFHENVLYCINYRVDMNFIRKHSMGDNDNSAKTVGGVLVLVLCTLSDSGLYLY